MKAAIRALLVGVLLAIPAARARLAQAGDDVQELIVDAATAHGVNANWMLRTAWCESRYNRYAVSPGGVNIGLFQLSRRGKLPVFYARGFDDPWDPSQQANFAAEQFASGQAAAWTCAR